MTRQIRLIRNSDSITFQKQLEESVQELENMGYNCEIQYAPIPLHDEYVYVLYSALVIARQVNINEEPQ